MQDENVIIDNRFSVRLIDFGSAVVFQPGQLFATFYGTVEYCAPEVLKGRRPLKIVLPVLLRMRMDQISNRGDFFGFFFLCVLYSTLLHLPPLRFHCVGGCWDRTQDSFDFCIASQTL